MLMFTVFSLGMVICTVWLVPAQANGGALIQARFIGALIGGALFSLIMTAWSCSVRRIQRLSHW